MRNLSIIILFILFLLAACQRGKAVWEGFDAVTWQNDPQACKGEREVMFDFFKTNYTDLVGWKESDLVDVLGKPDEKEMYKRGQWFYVYYFEPGPSCQPDAELKRGDVKRVEIRVSAVGEVTELILR